MAKKAGNLFTTAYLLLIFGVYPFYMKEGYVDIGKAKYHFFLYSSLAAVGILSLTGIVCKIQKLLSQCRQKQAPSLDLNGLSLTDLLVMLFAAELFLSFALSDYPREAFWGTEGWYMGLILFLTLCSLYFLISRFRINGKLILYAGMAASGAVFLLGILDRFSFYLIPLKIRQPGFISTLGNINWFCGYLSVLAPLGICPLIFSEQSASPSLKKRLVYSVYTVLAFTAGFCQGSDSILLFWAALLFLLLWVASSNASWLVNCLLSVSLWCFSASAVRILFRVFPGGYNYETNNLCLFLVHSNTVLFTGCFTFFLFLFLRERSGNRSLKKPVRTILAFLVTLCFLLWLLLALKNTKEGIPFLSQSSLFLLNSSWGNGRGAALKAGWDLFRQMPFSQKMLGAGPDCFSSLAYSPPELAAELNAAFGGSRLTNSHNELLTSLVNTGIAGTFLYLGIQLSFMARCLKRKTEADALYPMAACVFCYLIHNLVSFSQVLNLPFLFLILGMGEGVLRSSRFSP